MSLNGKDELKMNTMDVLLLMGDGDSKREDCRRELEKGGYRVSVAGDGRKGLALIAKEHPRVAVIDLDIPGMKGMEALKEIAGIDPAIVPIVVTGSGSVDSAVESMKNGASDYITRPFDPSALLESVRRAAALSESRKQSAKPAAAPGGTSGEAAADRQTMALKGLELLGQYYSLGLDKRDFLSELTRLEAEAKVHAETVGNIGEKEKLLRDMLEQLNLVDEIIAKYDYDKSTVLQIMLEVQTRLNWLPGHVLRWISRRLKVSLSHLYTIASFYDTLSLEPVGTYKIEVCTGTACHVRGANGLNTSVSALLHLEPGQTDADMTFTLTNVHCLGCCALAPVMKINDQYYSNPSTRDLEKIFESLRREKKNDVAVENA